MKMNDANYSSLYALFKGEPGTRKSTAAASFPTPQYWFSVDQKMNAMLLPMKAYGTDLAQVDYDDFDNYNDIRSKLEKLQVSCPYKTIIIDSLTSVGDATNRQTMKLKSGSKRADGSEAGNKVGGISVNTMEDYKAEASAFQELIALTKDIHKFHKVNIILIAHVIGERQSKETGGSTHFARIIVTGGKIISAKIPAYCGEVYHFGVEGDMDVSKSGSYSLLTEHTGDDFARTGLPLPKKIVFGNDPLYDKYILPAIKKMESTASVTKF